MDLSSLSLYIYVIHLTMKKQWVLGNLTSPLNSFTIYAVVRAVGTFARNYVVAYSPRRTGLTKWRKIYGRMKRMHTVSAFYSFQSALGLNRVISFINIAGTLHKISKCIWERCKHLERGWNISVHFVRAARKYFVWRLLRFIISLKLKSVIHGDSRNWSQIISLLGILFNS